MSVSIGMAFSAGGFLSFFSRRDSRSTAKHGEASVSRIQDGPGRAIDPDNCVSLLPLIDSCVSLIQCMAQRKNIEIKIDVSPNVPRTVMCDEAPLRQMLRLLLANAVETTSHSKCAFVVEVDPAHKNNVLRFFVANRTAERRLLDSPLPVDGPLGDDLAEPKDMPVWLQLAARMNGDVTVVRRSGKTPVLVFSAPMPAFGDAGMG